MAVAVGQARPSVAMRAAERLSEHRHDIAAVPATDAAGKERGELRIGEQPPEQAVDGSDQGGAPADRLVQAHRTAVSRRRPLSGGG